MNPSKVLARAGGLVLSALCMLPAALADDAGKFTIYMGAKPVASETYSIHKVDGKVELSGSGKAEIGTMKVNIEYFKVTTDDKFQPTDASAKAQLGQIAMEAKVAFADGKAKV